jgi:hypothetical protein
MAFDVDDHKRSVRVDDRQHVDRVDDRQHFGSADHSSEAWLPTSALASGASDGDWSVVVMHPLDRRGTHLDAPYPYLAGMARDSALFRGVAGVYHLGARRRAIVPRCRRTEGRTIWSWC